MTVEPLPPTASEQHSNAEGSIWQRILQEYSPSKASEPREAFVVVLGNPGSGARSLISCLQGYDPADGSRGFALEYDFCNVAGDGDEDAGLLHFWHLEGPEYCELLSVALTPERLSRTIVIIMVDLTSPHNIMATLEDWSRKLETALEDAFAKAPGSKDELRRNALNYLAEVQALQLSTANEEGISVDDADVESSQETAETSTNEVLSKKKEAKLGAGMLMRNLGIPIVVVGSKADQAEAVVIRDNTSILWGQQGTKPPAQILYFIQLHLRKWCLANGASLVYTSSLSSLNVGILRSYIHHRAFGYPLPKEPSTSKPDAVYIPWGSDSLEAIANLPVSAITAKPLDTAYGLVIRCTGSRQDIEQTGLVQSMDHQAFLLKQLEGLQKNERDADVLKGPSLLPPSKAALTANLAKRPSKDLSSPSSGDQVQKSARDFFANMDLRYKK